MRIVMMLLLFLGLHSEILRAFEDQESIIESFAEIVPQRAGLIFEIVDKTNAIKSKTDTLKIALSQQSVDLNYKITLDATGTYIFTDNIFADLSITGTNVTLDLAGKSLIGTLQVTGSVTIIKNGAIVAPYPVIPAMAAVPALDIAPAASMVRLKECHVNCLSSVQTSTLVDHVIKGRDAVRISGYIVDMHGCSIGAGTSVNTTTTTAPDGGTAIIIDGAAKKIRIADCIMVSGDGGSAQIGDGGNGGHGIHIKDTASFIEIKDCTIFETGQGGSPNGNGGHGVIIEEGVADACMYGCHIRNTGIGAQEGAGGKAVQDAVTTAGNYSIIYRNVAHNIANVLKFDLQGSGIEKGILSPTPPDATVINMFGNIYLS